MKKLTPVLFLVCFAFWGCADTTTLSISTTCGDAFVAAALDPSTPENVRHRDEVAVHVQLNSTLPAAVQGTLRVTLTPDSRQVGIEVREQQGVLPPGATEGDVWFPISEVSLSEHVLVELVPSGQVDPSLRAEQDVRFECVAACPANNVVVESPQPTQECGQLLGSGGFWQGELAAVSASSSYCNYHWQGGDLQPAPDLSVFRGVVWQLDCPVISAQQALPVQPPALAPAAVDPITPGELAHAAEQRLGIESLDQNLLWPARNERQVWLAILDTAAHEFTDGRRYQGVGRDHSAHGRLMGLVAQHTGCGADPKCPIELHNQLALPVVQVNARPDYRDGGFLGTRGQLATALHQLLDQWQAAAPKGEIPLVINLSLGWHSKHDCDPSRNSDSRDGCDEPLQNDVPSLVRVPPVIGFDPGTGLASFSLGTRAVLIEVARARCLGALVFAAAGNTMGGDDEGPLLPAGWNQLSLQAAQCQSGLGLPAPVGAPPSLGALVSAVGGVDAVGEPLTLTRRNSLPRLVGFGASVAVLDAEDLASGAPGWTGVVGPLSGTSIATAVVSGAAARLWADLVAPPGSTPLAAEVEERLFRSGEPIGARAELCLGTLPCSVSIQEVSACTPFAALGVATSCNAARVLPQPAQLGPPPPQKPADGVTCTTPPNPIPPGVSDALMPLCPTPTEARVDEYEAPWVFPQPSGVSCNTCSQRLLALNLAGRNIGTQYTIALTNAALTDRQTKLTAARVRVGQYYSELSKSLFINDRTISTARTSSTGTTYNPVNWSVYSTDLVSPLATLEVDRNNLQGTPLTGIASSELTRIP